MNLGEVVRPSQLIASVGRTHRMRTLLTWTGVPLLLAYGASAFATPPEPEGDADAVHEVLIRQEFAAGCSRSVECLVAVSGKPPSNGLVGRLRDLRYVHAMPPNYAGTGLVFDMGPVTFESSDRARVHGEMRGQRGPVFSSCTYTLRKKAGRWGIDSEHSECSVI